MTTLPWDLSPFALVLAGAAVVSLAVATVGWRHRGDRGGLAFTGLMASATLWAAGNALQHAATGLETALGFRLVGYLGHNLVALLVLLFALAYTGRRRWLTPPRVALLAAMPLATALVAAPTNAAGLHGLVWTDVSLRRVGGVVVLTRSVGPWYWAATGYNYAMVLAALAVFARVTLDGHGATRKQGAALLAGTVPPLVANVLWITGATTVDLTPAAFAVTGVAFGTAFFRYRLFDIAPVARDTLLDQLADAYLVLDESDRVVDVNATARGLATTDGGVVGRPASVAFPAVADVLAGDAAEPRVTITEPDGSESAGPKPSGESTATGETTSSGGTTASGGTMASGGTTATSSTAMSSTAVSSTDSPSTDPAAASAGASDERHFEVWESDLPVGGRLVFLRDVTRRRTVERRARRLIENTTDVTAVLASDGTISFASPSTERVLGRPPEALVGTSAFDLVHPDERAEVRETFRDGVDADTAKTAMECRVSHADGSWVWIETRGQYLLDDPAIQGVVVNARDVSERKRRERELRQQNERLEGFASVAAHDLRNPITIVGGHIELARETGAERHFDAIAGAADRMEALVEDLLALAHEGSLVDTTRPVDLAATARRAWETVETGGASLEVTATGTLEADESRLAALFENLFRNAVEHGTPRYRDTGVVGTVGTAGAVAGDDDTVAGDDDTGLTVTVEPTANGFAVRDDGVGIAPEVRERIFERSVSTDPEGTGLGLPIVRSVASAHGWTVDVLEATDGACFEVTGVEWTDGCGDDEGR